MAVLHGSYWLERRMILVRWAGAAGGAIALVAHRDLAGVDRWAGWALVLALAGANLLLGQWMRRSHPERDHSRLEIATFVFDIAVVFGFTLVFADNDGGLAWTLSLLIPLEGAFRRGMQGALAGAAVATLMEASYVLRTSGADTFDIGPFAYMAGLALAVGVVAGSVAEEWSARHKASEHQTSRLVELDRLKDRYIAVTSHEIRGPLTAMMAAVETVRTRWDALPSDRRDSLLDMVYLQGRQLDRLVEDLMISAEVQAGGLTLHPEWIELEPVVQRALDAATSRRRAHILEVFVEPLRCEIDPHRVSQIIRNLVENAFKYTPDKSRVAIAAKGVDGGIRVEIDDDGDGIPADKRDQLFEAFSRIEETAAGQEGVGLGLYVVSQLVAAMEGRIDLTSSSRGTTFSIFIPCNRAAVSQPHIGLVKDDGEHASG